MLIISSKEFRDKQKTYLDKVDEGVEVLVQRGKNKSYKITPVSGDDTLVSKEEFFAKLDRAMEEAKQGKVTRVNTREELVSFFDSL